MITNKFDKLSRLLELFGTCLPLKEWVHAGISTVIILPLVKIIFTVVIMDVKTLQVYMRIAVIKNLMILKI